MALTKSTITGRVPLPTDVTPADGEVLFTLSGFDTEGSDTVVPATQRAIIQADGSMQSDFGLWRNTAGLRGTHYIVTARWSENDRAHGRYAKEATLGRIQVGESASYSLPALLNATPLPPPANTYWRSITQSEYGEVIAAKDAALAAADIATVNADIYSSTSTGLAATTNGQQFQVLGTDEVIRYRNNSGSAVELVRYPTSAATKAAQTALLADNFLLGQYRPILLDLDGVLGEPDSVYIPRTLFYAGPSATWQIRTALNDVVMGLEGNYCRIGLVNLNYRDGGIVNSVYFDPSDDTIKLRNSSAIPTIINKLYTLFEITTRVGGWRSPQGLNVEVLGKPKGQGNLADLRDAVMNPLRDCRLTLIGDSITWGMTATGMADTSPRAHALTDVRNNITSRSWANLLRQWVAETACGGEGEDEPAPGVSTYEKAVVAAVTYDTGISAIPSGGRVAARTEGTASGALLRRYIQVPAGGHLAMRFEGDEITIVHGQFPASDYDFYVDGELVETFIGDAATAFGYETTLSGLGDGRHSLVIVANGTQFLRVEGITRTKMASIVNNGLIGTATTHWLPTGALLDGGVPADTTHLIVQLGTNDRANAGSSTVAPGAGGTYQNLHAIIDWLEVNRPMARIILMAPPHVPSESTPAGSDDVANAVRRVAGIRDVGFIDNHSPTWLLGAAGDTWLADGLHPNDLGHRRIFENIFAQILTAIAS